MLSFHPVYIYIYIYNMLMDLTLGHRHYRGCPRGVMVKAMDF